MKGMAWGATPDTISGRGVAQAPLKQNSNSRFLVKFAKVTFQLIPL